MIEGWSQWSRGAVERMDPSEQKIHTIGVFQNFQGYGGKFTRTATFYDGQLSGTVFTNALGLREVQEPETLHPCI